MKTNMIDAAIASEETYGCPFLWHHQERVEGVFVQSAKSKTTKRWVAWTQKMDCRMTAKSPMTESDPVFFTFGDTREQAIEKLVNDIKKRRNNERSDGNEQNSKQTQGTDASKPRRCQLSKGIHGRSHSRNELVAFGFK